jgi:DNA-binding CsgD family transcriptional regulator
MGRFSTIGADSPQASVAARWRAVGDGGDRFGLALGAASGFPVAPEMIVLARDLSGHYADLLDGAPDGAFDEPGVRLRGCLERGCTAGELFELQAALEVVLLAEVVEIDADAFGLLQARMASHEALRSGERAIVLAGVSRPAADETVVEPLVAAQLGPTLSARECAVLSLLGEGLRNGEIAAQLILSPETVRTYAQRAMDKLGATTRTQAVVMAIRRGEIG